jgi:hypothetical protein
MEQSTNNANKLLVPTISNFFIDAPQTSQSQVDSGIYGTVNGESLGLPFALIHDNQSERLPLLRDTLNDVLPPIPVITTKTEQSFAPVFCHRCGCKSREDIFCYRCGVKLYKLFEFAEPPDMEQLPLCPPSFCKRKRESGQFDMRRVGKPKRKRVSVYKNIFYGKQQECWMGNITYKGVIVRSCSKDEATAARILNTRCREKGIPIPNPHVGFATEQEARDKRKRGWRKRKQWDADIVLMQPYIGAPESANPNAPATPKYPLRIPSASSLDVIKTEDRVEKPDFYVR